MDISALVKPIKVPSGFRTPARLQYEHLIATPLGRNDCTEDLIAVNSNRELIRATRGGTWPGEELTEEYNWLDLVWHERENREQDSFAYAVRNTKGEYIGCFYLYPLGQRTSLTEELSAFDCDASWWTTTDAYERGDYVVLFRALQTWLSNEFNVIGKALFSNLDIPSA